MNMFFVHDIIKSVMRKCKLVCNFRVELKIMNVLFVHDIIKTDEWSDKIMNMFFVHDMISTTDIR
jgi:hypothetical protein